VRREEGKERKWRLNKWGVAGAVEWVRRGRESEKKGGVYGRGGRVSQTKGEERNSWKRGMEASDGGWRRNGKGEYHGSEKSRGGWELK